MEKDVLIMDNAEMEEEFAKLKQWYLDESKRIDEKYPYRGGFDCCKECFEERNELKKALVEKVQQLKEKYHIQLED